MQLLPRACMGFMLALALQWWRPRMLRNNPEKAMREYDVKASDLSLCYSFNMQWWGHMDPRGSVLGVWPGRWVWYHNLATGARNEPTQPGGDWPGTWGRPRSGPAHWSHPEASKGPNVRTLLWALGTSYINFSLFWLWILLPTFHWHFSCILPFNKLPLCFPPSSVSLCVL